ncbi:MULTISPECIES: LysR family transcriptional regulator [unclassified Streptomyces]|uniref:LysR family transcriptional regulator n=1 Tax=unclassified Streptomyces TaxID=2593676 RepID=UPI001CC31B5E|nr:MULTISPECIES: LysR family transcriptional regulator [unclassified Streptomyces]
MTMELRHLRAFLAIAEEGGITRAAARLHISQPALSRTLRALEEHLGVRLIDRSTHHLQLTDAGRAFRVRVAAAVAAVDAALDPGRTEVWPLRVGHTWSALGRHTSTVLRRWQQAHPRTPLDLLRIDDGTAGLAHGRVDAALLRGPLTIPGVSSALLSYEPRVAAVPADSDLSARANLVLADLTGHTVVLNTVSGTTTPQLWPDAARPASTWDVANTDDWLAAIAAGRGVGVSSAATAEVHPYPGVVYRSLADAPALPLHLVWSEPPAHAAIAELAAFISEFIHQSAPAPKPPA